MKPIVLYDDNQSYIFLIFHCFAVDFLMALRCVMWLEIQTCRELVEVDYLG